jgi:dihydroflavonol-4-reductase
MEKVFVTGADGMLGNAICRELIKQGYLVKALCLNNKNARTLEEISPEIIFGNVLDKELLLKEMKGCTYVIHVAAMTDIWPRRMKRIVDVNINGTRNVMEVAGELKLKRMVNIGSASSFEPGSLSNPGNEKSPFTGWKYGMDYLESKYNAQQLLIEEHKRTGFPVIIINPTFMIGAYDSGPSSGKMIIGLYKKAVPGYSSGGKNFVCSSDVAVAVVNALKMGREGECYIAGNHNMSYKDFFSMVSTHLNRKFTLRHLPSWIILFVGAINSFFARIFRKPPKLSYGIARLGLVSQYYSPEKARKELNMPQTPVETGVQQCLEWFEKNGYLK